MACSSQLKIDLVTIEDSPALMDLWFAAFSDSNSRQLFPNTPGMRKWLQYAIQKDLQDRPLQRYLKIIDLKSKDANDRPRIAAYAKLDPLTPEERGPRYPQWHDDMPKEICEEFVNRGENNRKRVMGNRRHICMFVSSCEVGHTNAMKVLDMVATHPNYRRQGAASMLVQRGCDLADVEGVEMYVSASKDGASLYAKFGFVDYSIAGQETVSMVRHGRCVD